MHILSIFLASGLCLVHGLPVNLSSNLTISAPPSPSLELQGTLLRQLETPLSQDEPLSVPLLSPPGPSPPPPTPPPKDEAPALLVAPPVPAQQHAVLPHDSFVLSDHSLRLPQLNLPHHRPLPPPHNLMLPMHIVPGYHVALLPQIPAPLLPPLAHYGLNLPHHTLPQPQANVVVVEHEDAVSQDDEQPPRVVVQHNTVTIQHNNTLPSHNLPPVPAINPERVLKGLKIGLKRKLAAKLEVKADLKSELFLSTAAPDASLMGRADATS